jgi:hypothetical protein
MLAYSLSTINCHMTSQCAYIRKNASISDINPLRVLLCIGVSEQKGRLGSWCPVGMSDNTSEVINGSYPSEGDGGTYVDSLGWCGVVGFDLYGL